MILNDKENTICENCQDGFYITLNVDDNKVKCSVCGIEENRYQKENETEDYLLLG